MANILDYLDWRGDLTWRESPFNEVDNLMLAELSFLELEGIVPDVGEGRPVPLHQAVDAFFERQAGREMSMGVLVPDAILTMARKMAAAPRFRELELSAFRSVLDQRREAQFAALTIALDRERRYLSFRGTDDTLVGWKEDFNMTFLPTVPSQRLAAEYVRAVAAAQKRTRLVLGGHSKGGNIAVYAAFHCAPAVQRRITAVYSNDGPGFKEPLQRLACYQWMRGKMISIVPESSVVGMLLEHEDNYTVVKSSRQGVSQHDGFSWEVLGTAFVRGEALSGEGRASERAIRSFLDALDDEQRRQFVDAMFEVLGSTNAQTLSQLDADWGKALPQMFRSFCELDRTSRRMLADAVGTLLRTNTEIWMGGLEERGQELRRKLGGAGRGERQHP